MKKNLDEIAKNLRDWSEENQEKRALLLLAIENVRESDKDSEFACTAAVCGSDMILTTSLANAFEDDENPVGNAMKKAIKFAALKAISKQMDKILESENEEESENAEQPETAEIEQTDDAETK